MSFRTIKNLIENFEKTHIHTQDTLNIAKERFNAIKMKNLKGTKIVDPEQQLYIMQPLLQAGSFMGRKLPESIKPKKRLTPSLQTQYKDAIDWRVDKLNKRDKKDRTIVATCLSDTEVLIRDCLIKKLDIDVQKNDGETTEGLKKTYKVYDAIEKNAENLYDPDDEILDFSPKKEQCVLNEKGTRCKRTLVNLDSEEGMNDCENPPKEKEKCKKKKKKKNTTTKRTKQKSEKGGVLRCVLNKGGTRCRKENRPIGSTDGEKKCTNPPPPKGSKKHCKKLKKKKLTREDFDLRTQRKIAKLNWDED